MLFSKAIFEITDKQAVISGLKKIKEFEQDKYGFVWFDKRNKERERDNTRQYGNKRRQIGPFLQLKETS